MRRCWKSTCLLSRREWAAPCPPPPSLSSSSRPPFRSGRSTRSSTSWSSRPAAGTTRRCGAVWPASRRTWRWTGTLSSCLTTTRWSRCRAFPTSTLPTSQGTTGWTTLSHKVLYSADNVFICIIEYWFIEFMFIEICWCNCTNIDISSWYFLNSFC